MGKEPGKWDQLSTADIAKEIAAYLPNPGQFVQAISAASTTGADDDMVLLDTETGQVFRLTIEELAGLERASAVHDLDHRAEPNFMGDGIADGH